MGLPGCLFVCNLILLLVCFLFNATIHITSTYARGLTLSLVANNE